MSTPPSPLFPACNPRLESDRLPPTDRRAEICARTWDRPYPQEMLMDIVPLGTSKSDWNFDVSKHKRVLNLVHEVTDEDNIKQDKSIDVYGRFDDEEEGEA